MISFGNIIVADVISYDKVTLEKGGPQSSMAGGLIKGSLDTHTHKHRMSCENWNYAAPSQGTKRG